MAAFSNIWGFLDDFEDLENGSEMVAETLEASKDNKAKVLPVKTLRVWAVLHCIKL